MIRVLIKAFLLFILIIVVYNIWKFFKSIKKIGEGKKQTSNKKNLVRDPVCKVYLPEERAIKLSYKGEKYFFCSEDCKKKFLQKPEKHISIN